MSGVQEYAQKHNLAQLLTDASNACYSANASNPTAFMAQHFSSVGTVDVLQAVSASEVADGSGGFSMKVDVSLVGRGGCAPKISALSSHSTGLANIHPSAARTAVLTDVNLKPATPNPGATSPPPGSNKPEKGDKSGAAAAPAPPPQPTVRWDGLLPAVRNVGSQLVGMSAGEQRQVDGAIQATDSTANFATITSPVAAALSTCVLRASCAKRDKPVYEAVAELAGNTSQLFIPKPVVTLFGVDPRHMGKVRVREVCVIPPTPSSSVASEFTVGDSSASANGDSPPRAGTAGGGSGSGPMPTVTTASTVAQLTTLFEVTANKLTEDSGGLPIPISPDGSIRYSGFDSLAQLVEFCEELLKEAFGVGGGGYKLGLVVDASFCYKAESQKYQLIDGSDYSGGQVAETLAALCRDKPSIVYLEDVLHDHDYAEHRRLMARCGNAVTIAGNNVYAGNMDAIHRGVQEKLSNNCVLRMNDCGTLSNLLDAAQAFRCYKGATLTVASERMEGSPEFVADLAVGVGARFVRVGGILRSAHAAILNRLVENGEALSAKGTLGSYPATPNAPEGNPDAPQVELPEPPTEAVAEVSQTKDKKKK